MQKDQKLSLRKQAESKLKARDVNSLLHIKQLSPEKMQKIVHELEVHQIELEMQNEELTHTQLELNIAKNLYFDLYDMAPIGYCMLDVDGLIQEANLSMANLLDLNRLQLIKLPLSQFIYREDQDIFYFLKKRLLETELKQECELRMHNDKQIMFWSHLIITSDKDSNNKQIFRLMINDISKRKEAEKKISIAATVYTNTSESILITDADGNIFDVNDAFVKITGYTREEILGKNPKILSSNKHNSLFYQEMWDSIKETGCWSGEIINKRKNGEIYPENLKINTIFSEDGMVQNYIGLFSDITHIKKHIQELEHIANYDVLTGLPNRTLFSDRLQNAMVQSIRRSELVAVVFLDLDSFKDINDTYGHDVGDKLLITLSKYMNSALREGDTLARIGGDEFAAVLVGFSDIKASLPILTRLLEAAAQKIDIDGHLIHITASLGITIYPQSENIDADHLLRQADQAMYEAKISGKNRYHFFNTEQNEIIKERYELIKDIKQALELQEFVLYYQPKVNMNSGRLIGVEALIRWQHPTKGVLSPIEFLPAIEGHSLSVELGEWVIHTALFQIELWENQNMSIPISVNIGARQLLEDNFVDRLETILKEHPKVKPSMLEIEVLETSKIEDVTAASIVISRCKDLGVLFSLDDFGTGYSSLTYLKQLPVSKIKIDQSFVKDMLVNPDDLAILDGIIKLSDAFRRHVIAEGVETIDQGIILLQLGCELAQGYVIARPMTGELIPDWLHTWTPNEKWTNQILMDYNQLQLLFAAIEYRAMIANITYSIKKKSKFLKIKNKNECTFSCWFQKEGEKYFKTVKEYNEIKASHDAAHEIIKQIGEFYQENNFEKALELLEKLYLLRDDLLKMLNRYVFIPVVPE